MGTALLVLFVIALYTVGGIAVKASLQSIADSAIPSKEA